MDCKLSNGDLVTLRNPNQVKERDRRKIESAYLEITDEAYQEILNSAKENREITKSRMTPADVEYMAHINDVCILALLEKWTTHDGVSVDKTEDSLGELDGQSYADLSGAAAPLIAKLETNFDPTPVGVESPTVPVSA